MQRIARGAAPWTEQSDAKDDCSGSHPGSAGRTYGAVSAAPYRSAPFGIFVSSGAACFLRFCLSQHCFCGKIYLKETRLEGTDVYEGAGQMAVRIK